MQTLEKSEVSLNFSEMTLADLAASRSKFRNDIQKIGTEDIQTLCSLKSSLLNINHEITMRMLNQFN